MFNGIGEAIWEITTQKMNSGCGMPLMNSGQTPTSNHPNTPRPSWVSKFHDSHQIYWYGIIASSHKQIQKDGCTHYVFALRSPAVVILLVDPFLPLFAKPNFARSALGIGRGGAAHW